MLGIMISIAIIALGIFLVRDYSINWGGLIIAGTLTLCITIPCPIAGFEEAEFFEETALDAIYVQDEQPVYVIKTDFNECVISYTDVKEVYGVERSKQYTTSVYYDTIVEDENCTQAVKREYVQKAKKSIWSLALFTTKYETVLIVPVGSVRE